MGRAKKIRIFSADFETTVYKGQTHTEVWAGACVELFTEDVSIFHSIGELWDYFISLDTNLLIYFHNLKFDGGFWLPFFMNDVEYTQAIRKRSEADLDIEWLKEKEMPHKSFKYIISDMGQFYSITVKYKTHTITIQDSLKLLPFSVKRIGEAFKTKHQKLDMQYKGFRYAGCEITDKEKEYIANDILVVKEALEIMYKQGHTKMTIGSCCLEEYKSLWTKEQYYDLFPDLTKIEINEQLYGAKNADAYIRKSYKGGWCYYVPNKIKKRLHNGTTADVNSLYPSMMSSESGNFYPIGTPTFWKGNYIPVCCQNAQFHYFFVRIRCSFNIKPNRLPCIQIKNNYNYQPNQWLITSDIYDKKTNAFYSKYIDENGEEQKATVELTLTQTDFILMQEQYTLTNFEILDGCYFDAQIGLFDEYIDKYKKIKLESTGAMRELAKLFLNNLYGKMASSTNSSWKFAVLKEDKSVGFLPVIANDKKAGYIAVGSAITSYARNFTIRAAQENYYGDDKEGFVYADTDSIHCDLPPDKIRGIKVHDKDFCCWKLEAQWDTAWFVRQKTYIEHVVGENLKPIESPYYNVKCAGMPDTCKNLLIKSMTGYQITEDDRKELYEEQLEFLSKKRDYEDFDIGLQIYGKLMPKRIRGGIILVDDYFTMR